MQLLYYQLRINNFIVRLHHEHFFSNATKVIYVLLHVQQQQEYDDIHITAAT